MLVHQFSIQVAKHVFWREGIGYVISQVPISARDAKQQGFENVLTYGLVVEGNGSERRCIQFARHVDPVSPFEMLLKMWHEAAPVLGRPDILKVNRRLSEAVPQLRRDVEHLGIGYVVAEGKDRSYNANLRVNQEQWHILHYSWGKRGQRDVNQNAIAHCLLGRNLADGHVGVFSQAFSHSGSNYDDVDWNGDWLLVGQDDLPRVPIKGLHPQREDDLLPVLNVENPQDVFLADEQEYIRDLAARILPLWPERYPAVARYIGITTKSLQRFLAQRELLDRTPFYDLITYLQIWVGEAFIGEDWESEAYPELVGSYLLIATTKKQTEDAYDELGHGGDLVFSVEVLPRTGLADPSWRYLLFASHSAPRQPSVIMFGRGTDVAELLDNHSGATRSNRYLINYQGQQTISESFYRDLVKVCATLAAGMSGYKDHLQNFWQRRSDDVEHLWQGQGTD